MLLAGPGRYACLRATANRPPDLPAPLVQLTQAWMAARRWRSRRFARRARAGLAVRSAARVVDAGKRINRA